MAAQLQTEIRQRRLIEARLADAQRIAHLGHWDWNIVTNELFWSDEIYRIFGVQAQEFPATYPAFLNAVHPEDREFVIQAVNRALFGGDNYSVEHRIIRPNGEVRIVYEQAEVTIDRQGKPSRMLGIVRDVTESRMASLELERKENMLRGVLQALPVGVWIADPTGRILSTNAAAHQIWGAAPHVGLSEYDAYQGWDLKSGQRLGAGDWALSRALLTRKPFMGQEARILTFDGRTRVIRTSAAPVIDSIGQLMAGIAVAEDITRHVAVREALSRSGEELRKLTSHQIRLRERERAAMARQLHEGIGQLLSAAIMQAGAIRKEASEKCATVDPKCESLEMILKEAIGKIRHLSSELWPSVLDHFGLEEALDWLVNEASQNGPVICSLSIDGELPPVDDIRALELFRICQEAVGLAVQHNSATRIEVRASEERSGIRLEVEADGPAGADSPERFPVDPVRIIGLRERATEMNGTFDLRANPDGRTVVSVWMPRCTRDSEPPGQ